MIFHRIWENMDGKTTVFSGCSILLAVVVVFVEEGPFFYPLNYLVIK